MRYPLLIANMLFWMLPLVASGSQATLSGESSNAVLPSSDRRWIVQDLHITSNDVLGQKNEAGQHLLICREGFETTIAGVHVAADRGVARIEPIGVGVTRLRLPGIGSMSTWKARSRESRRPH
jgi:hypothetical protein